LINGYTYEKYQEDCVYLNDIVFPYINSEYDLKLEIVDAFGMFKKVIVDFKVITRGSYYGECAYSKYCLRRKYL